MPKQIRLDFGRIISQKEIVLNKINFTFKNKNFSVKGKEIFYVFRIDENNTIVDKLNGSIIRKNPKQIIGPSLYPKGDKLFNRLNYLYLKKINDTIAKKNTFSSAIPKAYNLWFWTIV